MVVILISGKAGSGKDTVGEILEETLSGDINGNPFKTYKLSFAEPVKVISRNMFGWDGNKDEEGRKLLITVGHFLGKKQYYKLGSSYYGYKGEDITNKYHRFTEYYTPDINLWARVAFEKILVRNPDLVIISDCRYKNEVTYFKDRVDNIFVLRVKENKRTKFINHVSETDMDDYPCDYVINNNGNFEDLRKEACTFLSEILFTTEIK